MCARACMHACVCVRVFAGSHIDRKMIWMIWTEKTVLKIKFFVPSFTIGPSYEHPFYIDCGSAF